MRETGHDPIAIFAAIVRELSKGPKTLRQLSVVPSIRSLICPRAAGCEVQYRMRYGAKRTGKPMPTILTPDQLRVGYGYVVLRFLTKGVNRKILVRNKKKGAASTWQTK